MLTLSHLANLMALLLGERPETMQLMARNLREARLVASGGRGRGGAGQEPSHIANMIIAACASDQVVDAASAASTFADLELAPSAASRQRARRGGAPVVPARILRMSEPEMMAPRELAFATTAGAKLGDVVAGLVELAADGRLYSLLMRYAADFVDRDLLRAGADAIKHAPRGGRPAATAALAAKMAAHVQTLIDQSAVYLKISFLRPLPAAEIEFGTQHEGEAKAVLRTEFGLPAAFVANPRNAPRLNAWRRMDRGHRVTVSHRTLLSIGQAIAAEEEL
ncbi:MAG TPA: hypothetical protein VJ822_15785 [Dongiaceae bacterium]|nr:hypothetical protein [Dongiaceae bacterium]